MTSDIDSLKNIPDGKPVRIFLPLKNGPEHFRTQCVYQKTTPPNFTLAFKPGALPVDEIDQEKTCIISVDMGGATTSLEAVIHKLSGPQSLDMTIQKSISHGQMREFFRVDATTNVISKSFHAEVFNTDSKPWSLKGYTVDISGSGILAVFSEEPPADAQVRLEIATPMADSEIVKVLAHRVRAQKMNDGLYEVAYHFDDITTEDRDKIIGCCLVIQRKMLQLKVQVKNQ